MLMLQTSVYKACSKCPPAALMHAWMTVLLHQLGLVASQTRSPSGRSSALKCSLASVHSVDTCQASHHVHMIVKRVEIRRIQWPLFLPDKLWAISAKPVLRQWHCVSSCKISFFSSDSCNFCFMWMIWKKFSENTVVFLSIIWCKFQEFKLHGFREIEFFLGGCFFMPHPVHQPTGCTILEAGLSSCSKPPFDTTCDITPIKHIKLVWHTLLSCKSSC